MDSGRAAQKEYLNSSGTLFSPEHSASERIIALALAAASLVFLWPLRSHSGLFPDEGIALQGAARILKGEVLYHDFFAFLTPGSYYLLALLFRVFGTSYVVARTLLPAYGAVLTPLTYLMARRVASRWNSLLVAYLFLIAGIPLRPFVLHNWDSTVTATLALYAALRWLETRSSLAAFLSGTFAAVTFLFEQSKGAGVLLGLGAGVVLVFWLGSRGAPKAGNVILSPDRKRRGEESAVSAQKDFREESAGRPGGARTADPSAPPTLPACPPQAGREGLRMTASGASQIAAALAGLLWPVLATFVYFATKGSVGAMLSGWFWPLENYAGANRLPYGYILMSMPAWETLYGSASWTERTLYFLVTSPWFVIPLLPFLALLILAIHVRRLREKPATEGPAASQHYVLCGTFILGLTLSTIATGRPDFDHLLFLAPQLFLVFAWVFQEGGALPSRLLDWARPLVVVLVLVSFTAFGLAFWLGGAITARFPLETARGTVRVAATDEVVPYLLRHTQPGTRIFVYPHQPLYYFLSSTFGPTRFEYLQLGMHSRDQVSDAVEELGAREPPTVVYAPSFNYETVLRNWPATPRDALAWDPVRDYILSNYRFCRPLASQHWIYYAMVKRGLECP